MKFLLQRSERITKGVVSNFNASIRGIGRPRNLCDFELPDLSLDNVV